MNAFLTNETAKTQNLPVNPQMSAYDPATQKVAELIRLKRELGLTLEVYGPSFENINLSLQNPNDLLRNPEFVSRLKQDLYVSDPTESSWFKLSIKNGRLVRTSFQLSFNIAWMQIVNKSSCDFDYLVVGYRAGIDRKYLTAVVPRNKFIPAKIISCFPDLLGQTATDSAEIGKLLCHIISKKMVFLDEVPKTLHFLFIGEKQGFGKDNDNKIAFSPPYIQHSELKKHLPSGLLCREYPRLTFKNYGNASHILEPLFKGYKELQLLLLFRIASWFLFLFVKRDVYPDSLLIVKPTALISKNLLVAILNNTRYSTLTASPIGPNIKQLRSDLKNTNDGMVVVIDNFTADQVKKAEKGYDLLLNDVSGAVESSDVHHITALISGYADLYFPKKFHCVLDLGDTVPEYTVEELRNVLKCLDSDLICAIEEEYNDHGLKKNFKDQVTMIRKNIPAAIPHSKQNIYVILETTRRIYNEMIGALFNTDMERYVVGWLISQEQDRQTMNELICSEYASILNQKISTEYFRLVPKEETTPFDKGSHTIVVDKKKRQIYIETADNVEIATKEMQSISDSDSLTTALYSCEYLPHTPKAEKSIRISAITSESTLYSLYVHAISFALLTKENRQRFELIEQEAYLFRYEDIPTEDFLPLIKTIDGRYAGKRIIYGAEASNIYFGTGRTGSGKTWALAQILCSLFMLGHNVVVFDVSGSYTREKLCHMLPQKVVDCLFRFIHVGEGMGKIPVDLGSLNGCNNLPDRKRVVYNILTAALGKLDQDKTCDQQQRKALKAFLSSYLKDKTERVNLAEVTEAIQRSNILKTQVTETLSLIVQELEEIGCEPTSWNALFAKLNGIIVIDFGLEVGDSTHVLLDIMSASLFSWQMQHDQKFLSIAIDELADQDFSLYSPLRTIITQGRKSHMALLGATQDYFNRSTPYLDVMQQANMQSFCRPGQSEDRVAQKLGYRNAIDAGFHTFKTEDAILSFDALNKETGENDAIILRGKVVNFIDTPLYEKFLREYVQE